jgi:hypothetical protein
MADLDPEQARKIRALLSPLEAWVKAPPKVAAVLPGSRTASDDLATASNPMSHTVASALAHALDHLQCLDALMFEANTLPTWAPFGVVRGAIENAAVAVWLLAPDDQRATH